MRCKCGSEGPFNRKGVDSFQTLCQVCARQAAKDSYERNKQKVLERTRRQVQAKKALIASLKNKPCADCGRTFPPWAMQFDHLRDKVETLCFMGSNNRTEAAIRAEADKCEVVCILCHRHGTVLRGRYPMMTENQMAVATAWGLRLQTPQTRATTLPERRCPEPGQTHYQANKGRMNAQAAYNTRRRRFELAMALKSKPCVSCGRSFLPWMMDFDHRDPETKEASMAKLLAEARMTPQLEAEMGKCDLLCAVCHAARTQRSHGPLDERDEAFMRLWVTEDF